MRLRQFNFVSVIKIKRFPPTILLCSCGRKSGSFIHQVGIQVAWVLQFCWKWQEAGPAFQIRPDKIQKQNLSLASRKATSRPLLISRSRTWSMRRPLFLSNPSSPLPSPLPFPATTPSTLLSLLHASKKQSNPETRAGTKFLQAIRPRIEAVLCCRRRRWVRPIAVRSTRRLALLPLFNLPPRPAILWPTSPTLRCLLQIDGIAVAERGARGCVECRATTTPMWRSGPTGPRVSSSSTPPLPCSFLSCFALLGTVRQDKVRSGWGFWFLAAEFAADLDRRLALCTRRFPLSCKYLALFCSRLCDHLTAASYYCWIIDRSRPFG